MRQGQTLGGLPPGARVVAVPAVGQGPPQKRGFIALELRFKTGADVPVFWVARTVNVRPETLLPGSTIELEEADSFTQSSNYDVEIKSNE